MGYSQNLNKKWLVYTTISSKQNGWNSFNNNYILDFTSKEFLKIKTLGIFEIETIEYVFNEDTGIIYEKNGDILYKVKQLDFDKMVLIMGNDDEINVYLTSIDNKEIEMDFSNSISLLEEKPWTKNTDTIKFSNEKYLIADEIETNFKKFIEINKENNNPLGGAWLVDNYNKILFLDLFSERYNNKAIYVIEKLNKTTLKATALNNEGEILVLEFYR